MSRAWTVAWRDYRAAFNQPATYYFLAAFLLVASFLFSWLLLEFSDLSAAARDRAQANPDVLSGLSINAWVVQRLLRFVVWLLVVTVPLLTMRSFAEEQRQGTMELLLTAPVTPLQLVLGKFLGAWMLVLSAVGLTLWFPAVLLIVADPDVGPLFSGYAGLFLATAAFTAIGVLASALTDSPLLASFLAFVGMILSALLGVLGNSFDGPGADAVTRLSITTQVGPFFDGALDAGAAAWLVLGTAGLLFATQRVLESRRWR